MPQRGGMPQQNGRPPSNGITIQVYVAIIACLLITLRRKPASARILRTEQYGLFSRHSSDLGPLASEAPFRPSRSPHALAFLQGLPLGGVALP